MLSQEDDIKGIRTLKQILASHLGCSYDKVADNSTMSAMGVDSLAVIELADEFAARFGKELPVTALL